MDSCDDVCNSLVLCPSDQSIVGISLPTPYQSLQAGQWVKLICGASYQDMPTIRRLVMLYALAGVDCVDVAADAAVVSSARQGLEDAMILSQHLGHQPLSQMDSPWLMVSLNASEDPHFRKAYFEATNCPPACDRPCETLCPTHAIQFAEVSQSNVIPQLCYGCGRCIAVCPVNNIVAQSHQSRPEDFSHQALSQIDAVEIHTHVGQQVEFNSLWQRLKPWRSQIKLISVSCPDDAQIIPYLQALYDCMAPLDIPLIWQVDGRPMSGDLGKGTTHATIRLAQKILSAGLPGYVQLAGGTNHYTINKLRQLGLVQPSETVNTGLRRTDLEPRAVSGIAYGSYARALIAPMLEAIDQELRQILVLDGSLTQPQSRLSLPEEIGPNCSPTSVKSGSSSLWGATPTLMAGLRQAQQLVGALKHQSTSPE